MKTPAFQAQAARLTPAARAVADESRLRILLLLVERAATVTELSTVLDLPQPRVSGHLRVLTEAGLVSVQRSGRFRLYGLRVERAELLLIGLHYAAGHGQGNQPGDPATAGRDLEVDAGLRAARRCYDHIAGTFGVTLLDRLLDHGWLVPTSEPATLPRYTVSASGTAALHRLGIDPSPAGPARRLLAFGCTDWTEGRPHLGGSLGHQLTSAMQRDGLISSTPTRREITVHHTLDDWLTPS